MANVVHIAVASDEDSALGRAVVAYLRAHGHEVSAVGPLAGESGDWVQLGRAVASSVAAGTYQEAILLCWTGTGISIAANRVVGVRAALCADAGTAVGARKWNDANVLVLSNRLTSPELAPEILDAWFSAEVDRAELPTIAQLDPQPQQR